MLDLSKVKFGRKQPKYDHRLLRLESYLPASLPEVPLTVMWSNAVHGRWGLMGNDKYGDCTCAGWGHLHMLRSALAGNLNVMSDADVLALYTAVTGMEGAAFDLTTDTNDNGCVETDVLNYLHKQGEIGAFASMRPLSLDVVKFAIDAFEGVYMGAGLPNSIGGQDTWDVTGPLTGNAAFGSMGMHCMIAVDFDPDTVTFVTWGMLQKATWAWWNAYVDEAYAVLSNDIVSGNADAPSGFNLAQLQADLSLLTA